MNRFNRVSILSLLVFALTSLVVEARIFDNITQQMRFIFFNLSGTQAFSVWLKFAFFVIIFAVLYNGGIKAMKAEKGPMKNAMAVIAFVVGLTSAIFVPSKLLMYIFRLYSAVLVVLFAMLPAGVGFAINQTLFKEDSRMNRILRAVVYFLITVFIFGVIGAVDTMAGPEKALYEQILEPLTYGAIIAFVVGIINLLMALGGDTLASKAWDKMTGKPAAPAAGGGGGTPPTPPGPTPPARNEAEIRDLTNRMTQFINHVNSPPNGAVPLSDGLSNQFISDVEAILRGPLPSPLTVPALHAAAGPDYGMIVTAAHDFATNSLSPALGILHGYHTEMDGIYALATSSNQYNNVQDTVRQQYEAAVTAFLVAETRLTDLAGFIGAL